MSRLSDPTKEKLVEREGALQLQPRTREGGVVGPQQAEMNLPLISQACPIHRDAVLIHEEDVAPALRQFERGTTAC